ncbi:hypothetical protein HanRHA438_Chr04g0192981 [Helianthus annuus]|uniref:Uncharacterized protein n=1 Tax=Helianthus annuus TaxID=4232 RepID=A0A251V171_HELAN|nr:hypothetical protein HanXRQr2_Chr04g0183201 [Helianthus annuus]KAJ0590416.1 hypothetical protein HanIR_Chr04g0197171 [Helianthus annuus]KAJ0928341.1 hypothetical protein HanRHA438_Chr04g0192981 [Helianthus annuus]KAJ0932701.1 hypothetical protein HanPSC8_Chr04g0176661 [Helianthus annuus]
MEIITILPPNVVVMSQYYPLTSVNGSLTVIGKSILVMLLHIYYYYYYYYYYYIYIYIKYLHIYTDSSFSSLIPETLFLPR